MILELAVATLMVALTVVMHGTGLALISSLLPHEEKTRRIARLSPSGAAFTTAVAMGLVALHSAEIWLYAGLYRLVGVADDLRRAVYVSTISYGAIGFSDAEVADPWRLVGGIEGINGILLIGWSTAFFVTVMGRFSLRAPRRDG